MKLKLAWDYHRPRRAITIRLVVGAWLILLTVILHPSGRWLLGLGAADRRGSCRKLRAGLARLPENFGVIKEGIRLTAMSLWTCLLIWLARRHRPRSVPAPCRLELAGEHLLDGLAADSELPGDIGLGEALLDQAAQQVPALGMELPG